MSPVPKRNASERAQSNSLLTAALKSAADARGELQRIDEQINRALQSGADEFDFAWRIEDERDAQMHVYFQGGEELEILACRLQAIDERPPSIQERLQYEPAFIDQLHAGGDLWLQVASHLWERASQ